MFIKTQKGSCYFDHLERELRRQANLMISTETIMQPSLMPEPGPVQGDF